MVTKADHRDASREVGSFWRQGNPFIRSLLNTGIKQVDVLTDTKILLNGCMNYFNWVDKTPWKEHVIDFHKGQHYKTKKAKLRAYTLEGLCAFLGVSLMRWRRTLTDESASEDILNVMDWAQNVIYEQTFTAAAAGLLKDTLIIRKLGLAEKSEQTGPNGGPIATEVDVKQGALEFTEMVMRMAQRNADAT